MKYLFYALLVMGFMIGLCLSLGGVIDVPWWVMQIGLVGAMLLMVGYDAFVGTSRGDK